MELSFKIAVFSFLCLISSACHSSQGQVVIKNVEETAPVSPTPVELTAAPESTQKKFTPKQLKRRAEVHKLMLKGEYLHDGALELLSIGDISSVPALLVVLKKHPPRPDGVMICTTAHAVQALQKITGANLDAKYEAWSSWWEEHQRKQKEKAQAPAANSPF